MSTKRIVYTRSDGGVSVLCPSPEYVAQFATEDAAIAALREINVPPDAVNVYVCEVTDIYPPNKTVAEVRRFRNCWRRVGMAVPHVDMPLARAQRMAEVRAEGDKRLVASDELLARAVEVGTPADVAALRQYRQALRDVPRTADLSGFATPEALANFEPVWPPVP